MCDIDHRVKLSEVAAQHFSSLNAHERQLALRTLTYLADAHEQGVPHTKYLTEISWAESNIFHQWGVRIIYGIGALALEIDWIDFDPPPRGGGKSGRRPTVADAYEFEVLPIVLWRDFTCELDAAYAPIFRQDVVMYTYNEEVHELGALFRLLLPSRPWITLGEIGLRQFAFTYAIEASPVAPTIVPHREPDLNDDALRSTAAVISIPAARPFDKSGNAKLIDYGIGALCEADGKSKNAVSRPCPGWSQSFTAPRPQAAVNFAATVGLDVDVPTRYEVEPDRCSEMFLSPRFKTSDCFRLDGQEGWDEGLCPSAFHVLFGDRGARMSACMQ
ncbi:hypothetical protein QA645_41745 [Bradyrhizobium sp. CIAT3101]|uniref:hypothetical protein n=1 Tax=Bradyrhizobium sp. CIAT3101 TaxID=439387 RepID=UPI0024B15575|nr:hypothetical protein [Bradyrhizobium sp. CIAT3101]WFU80866.1 hypothetical protein QA645_41745 [Bradyrhizobium sp. CIAT3101]